jgi:hypothetical protein
MKRWPLAVSLMIVGVFVAGSLIYIANADSTFNLKDSFGIYIHGTTTYLPTGALVQLVWSGDNAYHPAVVNNLDAAGYLTSGDYILFQTFSPQVGGWTTPQSDLDGTSVYSSGDIGGSNLPGGFVYARVYEYFNSADPTAGTWYLQSALVPVSNDAGNPLSLPDIVDVAPGPGQGEASSTVAVPEPMSIAIFGFGLMSLVMWRWRHR